jgi:hypothetical protein
VAPDGVTECLNDETAGSVTAGVNSDSGQANVCTPAQRVRDLRDLIDMTDQVAQDLDGRVAADLDLVGNPRRHRRVATKLTVGTDHDTGQRDASTVGLTKQVIRDAPGDRKVEEFSATETEPAPSDSLRAINHDREWHRSP